MNSKALLAIAAFAALTGTAARADDITIDNAPLQSTRTRAEVQAELAQFNSAGVNPWSLDYNPLANFQSTKSRAQVQAELAQYVKEGVDPWSLAYDQMAHFQSTKTRAQVRADYLAHRDEVAAMQVEYGGGWTR
ncbi:MAG: hypothetical protein JWQ07_2311 [Ramlibacter sp.]|nr:hypothetical protein [Ramlibacter sp.]